VIYDWHLDLADLCAVDYLTAPTVARSNAKLYPHDGAGHYQGVRLYDFGATHLDDWRDIEHDIDAMPVRDAATGGHVHAGFHADGQLILADVLVDLLPRWPARFVLFGHSLAGACALDVGVSLAARGIKPLEIVTFDAPRVGFADYLAALSDVSVTQYRWRDDRVSRLPPKDLPFPWIDTRPLVQLDAERSGPVGPAEWIVDHAISNICRLRGMTSA
jgi:hypothetical protein